MTHARPYNSPSGGIAVLYLLAVASEAQTASDLAADLDASADAIGTTLARLYKSGYVERERRSPDGDGPPPYEYVLATE